MKMNMKIATAILAWCEAIDAAALPQVPGLALPPIVPIANSPSNGSPSTVVKASPATSSPAAASVVAASPPAAPFVPGVPLPLPHLPLTGLPPVPAGPLPAGPLPAGPLPVGPLPAGPLPAGPLPDVGFPPTPLGIPPVPLTVPNLASSLPKLSVPDLPLPHLPGLPLPVIDAVPTPAASKLPGAGDVDSSSDTDPESIDSLVKVGKIVLSNILNLLWKGAQAAKIPDLDRPGLPVPPPDVVNATVPSTLRHMKNIKRQAATSSTRPAASATPAAASGLGGLTSGLTSGLTGGTTGSNPLGGLTSGLTSGLTGGTTGSNPLGGLTSGLTSGLTGGSTGSNPLGGLTSGLTSGLTGGTTDTSPLGGLTSALTSTNPLAPVTSVVGGLTSGLASGLTSSNPLGPVASAVGNLGGVTNGLLGNVANTVGNLPIVGGALAPVLNTAGSAFTPALNDIGGAVAPVLSSVGNALAPVLNPVGNVLSPVLNAVGGTTGTGTGTAGTGTGITGTGTTTGTGGTSSAFPSGLPGPYPLSLGIPGTDPVGGLSIAIIATLLSLLKKDPLSLFGGLGNAVGLLRREVVPDFAETFEFQKRQLSSLPSLSGSVPGIGIGSLPLSGIPGVSPDLAFLVGSIAKNIAIPGGKGLGSVTGNILSVLNSVVPNFLFKLPVVQDSVPTFGVLQLLASINPPKFGVLTDLTNFANLWQAANSISASDLAFIRTLPLVSPDPSNLITTITSLTDNILSLPGNVINLRASVSVVCLKNLGLSVAGL